MAALLPSLSTCIVHRRGTRKFPYLVSRCESVWQSGVVGWGERMFFGLYVCDAFEPQLPGCAFLSPPSLRMLTTSHCRLSSHQPMFKKHLPPSRNVFLPGTKSAPLCVPRRLPRGWPSVSPSRPLPNKLWKLSYKIDGVQIRWAWTGEIRTHGTNVSRKELK